MSFSTPLDSGTMRPSTPAKIVQTFWRSKLHRLLMQTEIIESITLKNRRLDFQSCSWERYWGNIPQELAGNFINFHDAWKSYIDSGFDVEKGESYCECAFECLQLLMDRKSEFEIDRQLILKLVSFENIALVKDGENKPFGLLTSNLRNPFLTLFRAKGLMGNQRGMTHLLPLAMNLHMSAPYLFYHYRKQKLLKNSDHNLLFMPAVDLTHRPKSFQGLDDLVGVLLSQWDSRVKDRVKLLSGKVIIPLLEALPFKERSVSVLDIGSGDGILTEQLVHAATGPDILKGRKLELTMLDVVSGARNRKFNAAKLLNSISKIEHIASDYLTWLKQQKERYDLVFIFRMLHNVSNFEIRNIDPAIGDKESPNRYPFAAEMNIYYRALQVVFPWLISDHSDSDPSAIYHPFRVFNQSSLILPDGSSLLQRLCEFADNILIEDADLTVDDLVHHLHTQEIKNIKVYDLSKHLRLSVNHIYWITTTEMPPPLKAACIWPQ